MGSRRLPAGTQTAEKKRVVLDTITTRFLMLFLVFLCIPMFSLVFFMYTLLDHQATVPGANQPSMLQAYHWGIYLIAVTSLVLSAGVAMVAARTITQPLLRLIEQVEALSRTGNWEESITLQGVQEIHQLSHAFNRMLARLRQEHQMRDEFVATLTHDLKVPLLAEKQTLDYLERGTYGVLSTPQHEMVQLLQGTNQSNLGLVNGILEVSRYEAGQAMLRLQEVEVKTLLQEVIAEIQPLAQAKSLSLQLTGETTPVKLHADPLELKRVLMNLLNNAIINTPKHGQIYCAFWDAATWGQPLIQQVSAFSMTTLSAPLLASGHVLISIQDSGVGFTKEDLPFLFKRFAANRGRNPMSIGLGLYNAFQVIEAHGGKIWVETTEGEGAAVNFLLPTHSADPTPMGLQS